jgi:hypothetical protein
VKRFSTLRLGQATLVAFIAAVLLSAFAVAGAGVSPAGTSTPAAESAYPKRVTICHRTGKKLKKSKYRTIRISRRALKAHLRHGDGIGRCPRAVFTICHKTKKAGKKRTMRVRGWKAHRKHMRHGDKIRACPKKKKKKGQKK